MGELATVKDNQHLTGWLSRVGSAQQMWLSAIQGDDQLRLAFAEAEAKMILIESLDEKVSAYLLRFCDPRLSMVEIVNNPTNEEKIRITAMAILTGLVPGNEDFAVFGGKGGAKLYIKENGYRKLFARLNGATPPDVSTGHPVFTDLGTGKKVWRVSGVASCEVNKKPYEVERTGDYAIGIPGYDSDNVAGIAAKAQRRLLQLLWKKVVNVGIDDAVDEDETPAASVIVQEPKQIEAPAEPAAAATAQPETQAQIWAKEWKHFAEANGSDHAALQIARRMREATNVDDLSAISLEADQLKTEKALDQRTYQKIGHYFGFRLQQLQG